MVIDYTNEQLLMVRKVMFDELKLDEVSENIVREFVDELRFDKTNAEQILRYYTTLEPYMAVNFVRKLTDANINLTYSAVPYFQEFVLRYAGIMRSARTYRGDE